MQSASNQLSLTVLEHDEPEVQEQIRELLRTFNRITVPEAYTDWSSQRTYDLIYRDEQGEIAGAILNKLYWGDMYIAYLFVREDMRGQDIGSRLIEQSEQAAIERDCTYMWVTTFSWQARGFYEKHGFRIVGEMQNHPPGHSLYTLRKDFTDENTSQQTASSE
jgi:GNAT superfamily N-acetyltransferase